MVELGVSNSAFASSRVSCVTRMGAGGMVAASLAKREDFSLLHEPNSSGGGILVVEFVNNE